MARGMEVELKDEDDSYKERPSKAARAAGVCPVCGMPGGKYRCRECGWGIEELGPELSTSMNDPVSTIMHAKLSFSAIRKENEELRQKLDALMTNNRKLTDLVTSIEKENQALRFAKSEKYVYRYDQGGMVDDPVPEESKLHMKGKDILNVTIEDINDQLAEIAKLLERHGKINLNNGAGNNK